MAINYEREMAQEARRSAPQFPKNFIGGYRLAVTHRVINLQQIDAL